MWTVLQGATSHAATGTAWRAAPLPQAAYYRRDRTPVWHTLMTVRERIGDAQHGSSDPSRGRGEFQEPTGIAPTRLTFRTLEKVCHPGTKQPKCDKTTERSQERSHVAHLVAAAVSITCDFVGQLPTRFRMSCSKASCPCESTCISTENLLDTRPGPCLQMHARLPRARMTRHCGVERVPA